MVEPKLTLTESRVKKFRENVREEYDYTSVIKQAVSWRQATPLDKVPFAQIGMRFFAEPDIFIDSYSAGTTYISPEIFGVGRSIALGEEKYLVETLEKGIKNRRDKQSLSFETISQAIREAGPSFAPSTVFIPLDFYLVLHASKEAKVCILYEDHDCFLFIGSTKVRVFWSNKYVPFDSLIFVDQRLGEWIVKPDPVDKHWVTVDIRPANEKVDVIVKTVARYSILDPEAGLILKVPSPK